MKSKIKVSIRPGTPKALPASLALTGVNYWISRNVSFTDMVLEELNSTDLKVKKIEVELEEGATIYIKTQYVYNDDPNKVSAVSRISSLRGDQRGIHISDSIVATPGVSIDVSYDNNPEGELYAKTTPFKMYTSVGKIESTTWRVRDIDQNILFESEEDTVNLETIKLPETITKEDNVIIEAIHNASTLVSSNVGRHFNMKVSKTKNLFSVKKIGRLVITRDVYFEFKISTLNYKSMTMTVLDDRGVPVYVKKDIKELYTFVPRDTLLNNVAYTFEFKMDTGTGYSEPYTIQDISSDIHIIYEKEKRYLDKYDYKHLMQSNGRTSQTVHQLYNGIILMTKNDSKSIYMYKYVRSNLVAIGKAFDLPVEVDIKTPELYVEQMANGDIVVSYTSHDEDTYMHVFINTYTFNPVLNSFNLIKTVNLNKIKDFVKSGSITCAWNDKIYYVVYDAEYNSTLVEYDPQSFTTASVDIPFDSKSNVSILRYRNDEILVLGGSDVDNTLQNDLHGKRINNKVYSYNILTKTFTEIGVDLLKDVNVDYDSFLPVLRHTGDVTLFLNTYNDNPNTLQEQHTYVIDLENKVVNKMDSDHIDDLPYLNTVILYGGDVLRFSSLSGDVQKLYSYISDTMLGSEIDDNNNIVRNLNTLTISTDSEISEESLGQYDKVVIEGDGILNFVTPRKTYTFTKETLVITRDTIMTKEEYEAGHYETIFAVTGSLVIKN